MSTFVSVGNLKKPFRRLLDAVSESTGLLPRPIVVQHGHTPFAHGDCEVVSFLGMEDFQRRISNASVVILHAGAGSIITALQMGKRPIVMARRAQFGEHIDDHQVELVRELAVAGKIHVVDDAAGLQAAVRASLSSGVEIAAPVERPPTLMAQLLASDLEAIASRCKEHH